MDHLANHLLLVRVQPFRRLVEEQHGRIVQQRLRQRRPPAVALRQRVDRLVAHLREHALLEDRVHPAVALLPGEPAQFREEAQEPRHRHLVVERRVLRHVADLLLRRHRIGPHVDPVHRHRPRRRRQVPRDHPDRRRLARPVRPQHPQHRAFAHLERHVVHGRPQSELFDQMLYLDHVRLLFFLDIQMATAGHTIFVQQTACQIFPQPRKSAEIRHPSRSTPSLLRQNLAPECDVLSGLTHSPRPANRGSPVFT